MGFLHFVGLLGLVAFTQAGVVSIAEDFAAIPFTTPEKARGLESRNTENNKILDGFEAPKGLLPWQVSLRLTRTDGQVLGCGGSVISQQWVLTAAHCTLGMVFCTVRLGMNNLTTPELVIETTSWVNHPQYNPTNLNHDLSLVNLGRLVHYSDLIQPVRLQSIVEASLGVDGLILRASGFGLTDDTTLGGRSSEVLNYVDVRGISSALCMAYYGSNTIIYSTLCTMGLSSIRQGTCQGDSGGPLIRYDAQGVPVQAGVISFVSGQGCHQDHPAGYVYIGYYHPWLTQVTGINFA